MIMNFEAMHTSELGFIRFIHEFRTPFLDRFFEFLNFFDTWGFYFILIPIVWLGVNWRTGFRLFVILLISGLVNHTLKDIFSSPRPYHVDPSLGLIQVNGYGFPSGAAQSVILLSGIMLSTWKSHWAWVIAALYIGLISFSRVYLGVHFPTDILGGWIIGLSLWVFFEYVQPVIERRIENQSPSVLFLLSQVLPLAFILVKPTTYSAYINALAMGMGAGLFINHIWHLELPSPRGSIERVLRIMVGIFGTFLFYKLILLLSFESKWETLFSRFFLLGLWSSFGCNLLCRKLMSVANFSYQEGTR